MRELDKSKVYDLSELTSEERVELFNKNFKDSPDWLGVNVNHFIETDSSVLKYERQEWQWISGGVVSGTNAKELFYTLENIQVDCSELSEDEIDNIVSIYEANNIMRYKGDYGRNNVKNRYNFIMKCYSWNHWFSNKEEKFNTITYDKFMELFAEKEELNCLGMNKQESDAFNKFLDSTDTPDISYKPKHYSKGIDTFARMEANCTKEECLAFAKGNIDKYNFRNKGQDVEDLKKIKQYADWALKIHAQK